MIYFLVMRLRKTGTGFTPHQNGCCVDKLHKRSAKKPNESSKDRVVVNKADAFNHFGAGFTRTNSRGSLGGFTLIEVTIVMAITTLMMLVLIGFYRDTQKRTLFRDGVERLLTDLEKIKTEANSSFTTGTGDNAARVFFGKAVSMNDNSSALVITTMTADRNDSGALSGLQAVATTTVTLPWGVYCECNSTNNQVVFSRAPTDGKLDTYVLDKTANLLDPTSYSASASSATTVDGVGRELRFYNADASLNATLSVDGASSEVARQYNN